MVLLGATTAATTAVPGSVLLDERCAAGMIGPRGDKCVRIKAHPSHSIIESVHQWQRDGLFPTPATRSEDGSGETPQQAVAPQIQRTAAPRGVARSASAAHVSARAQASNRNRHQQMTPKRAQDLFFPAMIPEPDYSDSEDEQQHRRRPVRMPGMAAAHPHHNEAQLAHVNDEGLIVPRKLPNPCAESAERKSLHRELLFNQKMGKSVLGQKSELQKAMEKMKEEQRRKELEEERVKGRTALEKRLEEQANKLKLHEESEVIKTDLPSSEESEFLRVHARVCSHTLPVDSKS
ncbi:uncharacterized protein [Dermacentor andersoni]|uniref:uncharacterized protein isoform X1 n=1 Tax=Dermacentor andersoni TaxID=34620 RepID=UPI00215591D8|nr:uncharacterized protein LOC126521862 isoform X1 [Dermacentor andersoni]